MFEMATVTIIASIPGYKKLRKEISKPLLEEMPAVTMLALAPSKVPFPPRQAPNESAQASVSNGKVSGSVSERISITGINVAVYSKIGAKKKRLEYILWGMATGFSPGRTYQWNVIKEGAHDRTNPHDQGDCNRELLVFVLSFNVAGQCIANGFQQAHSGADFDQDKETGKEKESIPFYMIAERILNVVRVRKGNRDKSTQ